MASFGEHERRLVKAKQKDLDEDLGAYAKEAKQEVKLRQQSQQKLVPPLVGVHPSAASRLSRQDPTLKGGKQGSSPN